MNWGTFRLQVLRTSLADPPAEDSIDGATFSAANVYDAFCDALRTFAWHTAKPVELDLSADVDGETTTFTLDPEPYEDLEVAGEVFTLSGGTRTDYYPEGDDHSEANTFVTWERTTLVLSRAPAAGKTLKVRYYTLWNMPADVEDDEFELDVPSWSIGLLKKLVAANCFEGQAVQIASVVQWEDGIERNPWRRQAEFLKKQYEAELTRHQRQNRLRRGRYSG